MKKEFVPEVRVIDSETILKPSFFLPLIGHFSAKLRFLDHSFYDKTLQGGLGCANNQAKPSRLVVFLFYLFRTKCPHREGVMTFKKRNLLNVI